MTTLPPPELTDPRAVTQRLQQAGYTISAAEPSYVRHKPGETTIIAYRLTPETGPTTWGYGHWCHDPARADQIHHKAQTLRPCPATIGPGVARLDPCTIIYAFPNDARLRRLRWYTDPRKIKRSLEPLNGSPERISGSRTTVDVLRYKPERRVVTRVNLATTHRTMSLLVRYSTRRQAAHLNRVATHLRSHLVDTPAPVAHLDDDRVAIHEFIDGTLAGDAVLAGSLDPSALAKAIAHFHCTPPPPHTPRRTAEIELARALDGLTGLSGWHPNLTEPARATAEFLRRDLPAPTTQPSLLHGDLHTKNILISDARITFIDLERVASGPAAIDLGFLTAHAIALGMRQPGWSPDAEDHARAVIDRYQASFAVVDPAELAWHTAIGLVEQAVLVARHLEDRWHHTSPALLELAQRHLKRTRTGASAQ